MNRTANGAVYIHTRDRLQFLDKTLHRWPEVTPDDVPITLVVEPTEVKKHTKFLRDKGLADRVDVLAIHNGKNLGMGNSRNIAFLDAVDKGYESFITTDDDMFPRDDPSILLDTATMDTVFAVGGYFSMYGLLMKIKPLTGLYKVFNGLGKRCFAINTALMEDLGGFPVEFKGYDDHELQRQAIAHHGMPWHMDSDFMCVSIAAIGDPGGMTSLPGYSRVVDRKHTAHLLTHKNWPGFVSNPDRCDPDSGRCSYMMQWKKFHQAHNVPLEG